MAQQDIFNVVTGASVRHDSNLFRRPEATAVSDTITTGYLGLLFDKPYGLQRFQADVRRTAYRYEQNTHLGVDATDYRGAWLWTLTPRITGALTASRSETPTQFEVSGGTQRNVGINEEQSFKVDGWITGGWHALAGISESLQKSEVPIEQQPDFRSRSKEAGIRYVTPGGNFVTATRRSTDGHYLNALIPALPITANRPFHEDASELVVNWSLTGKSSVNARAAWIERESLLAQRGFSGPVGDLSYTWTPTGKLSLAASARRSLSPLQDTPFSYSQTDAFSLSPIWRITPKTSLRLLAEHSELQYRGNLLPLITEPARKEITDNVLVGLDWTPTRTLSLGATLQRERRSSNIPGFDYDATIISLNAAFRF